MNIKAIDTVKLIQSSGESKLCKIMYFWPLFEIKKNYCLIILKFNFILRYKRLPLIFFKL